MKKYLFIILLFIFSVTLSYAIPIGGGPVSGGGGSGTTVSDDAYDATSWNGNTDAASKNAIRDKIETLAGGHNAVTLDASATAGGLSIILQDLSFRAATNSQTGYMTPALVTAIEASTAAQHTQGTDTALGVLGTKNPPIDADKVIYRDSTNVDTLVTSTWTQIKAFLKTYFDTLYQPLAAILTNITNGSGTVDLGSAAVDLGDATTTLPYSTTIPTVLSGDPDSLDDTLATSPKLYLGGYIRYNAAGEATLDAFSVAGETLSILFYPSVAIIVNPNASQTIIRNGVALTQGEALINDSNYGLCVLTYLGSNSIDAQCSSDITEETP